MHSILCKTTALPNATTFFFFLPCSFLFFFHRRLNYWTESVGSLELRSEESGLLIFQGFIQSFRDKEIMSNKTSQPHFTFFIFSVEPSISLWSYSTKIFSNSSVPEWSLLQHFCNWKPAGRTSRDQQKIFKRYFQSYYLQNYTSSP